MYVTTSSEIHELTRSNGTPLWNDNNRGGFQTPALANGVIYTGGINAFNQSTGQDIWYTTKVGYEFPVVAEDTVYAVGWLQNEICAFNATTGDKLWNYTLSNRVGSSPAVANGTVFFGCYDDYVYALDGASGNQLWNYTLGSVVEGSPAVCGGAIYITSHSNLYALNASTGAHLWNFSGFSDPVVVDGVIYGHFGNRMYAIVDSSVLLQPTAMPTTPFLIPNWFPVTLVTVAVVVGTVLVIAALLILRSKHRIKVKAEIAAKSHS